MKSVTTGILIILVASHMAVAQDIDSAKTYALSKNIIKFNVTALLLNNYSFSYERRLARKVSIQIGYRFQPYGYVTDNVLGKLINKHSSIDPAYFVFKSSNSAFTVDLKYYLAGSNMKGTYIGLYSRHAKFTFDNLEYTFITDNQTVYQVPLVSDLKGTGIGLSIGKQFIIKKRITLDYYILAAHYGKLRGSVQSHKDLSGLTADEQAMVKSNVESLYTINDKKYLEAVVDNEGLKGTVSGPFIGIRAGISLGFAF